MKMIRLRTMDMSEEEIQERGRLPNIHPGEVLQEDFLVPLKMTSDRLAKGLRLPQTAVSEILSGKRSITAHTALRLSRFFGTTPQFWLNLQASYDLEEERIRRADDLERIEPWNEALWQG